MSDSAIPQRYSSMSQFVLQHRLWLPKPRDTWRLLARPCLGYINGLSINFNGIAMATNGIMVAIMNYHRNVNYGHLEWFIKDDDSYETDLDSAITEVRNERLSAKAKLACVDTFSNLFDE